jgi:acyl carrier protein
MDWDLVRRLIAEQLAVEPDAVIDSASFRHDLGADSLDLVELTMVLEERLEVSIGDEESEGCFTVGDAFDLLQRKLAARSATGRLISLGSTPL